MTNKNKCRPLFHSFSTYFTLLARDVLLRKSITLCNDRLWLFVISTIQHDALILIASANKQCSGYSERCKCDSEIIFRKAYLSRWRPSLTDDMENRAAFKLDESVHKCEWWKKKRSRVESDGAEW